MPTKIHSYLRQTCISVLGWLQQVYLLWKQHETALIWNQHRHWQVHSVVYVYGENNRDIIRSSLNTFEQDFPHISLGCLPLVSQSLTVLLAASSTLLCFTGPGNTKRIDKEGGWWWWWGVRGSAVLMLHIHVWMRFFQRWFSMAKSGAWECTYIIALQGSEQRDWAMRLAHATLKMRYRSRAMSASPWCPWPVSRDLQLLQIVL